MYEIRFEELKKKAKRALAVYVNMAGGGGTAPFFDPFQLLLAVANSSSEQLKEWRESADEFKRSIRPGEGATMPHVVSRTATNPFSGALLKFRECGLQLIDRWDVRQVGKLIEIFPEIVPPRYRGRRIEANLVDNAAGDDSEWVVFFHEKLRQDQANAPASPSPSP